MMKTLYSVLCDLDLPWSLQPAQNKKLEVFHMCELFSQKPNLKTFVPMQAVSVTCNIRQRRKALYCRAVNLFSPLAAVSGACNITMQWTKRPKLSLYCLSIPTVMILLVVPPHMLWHSYPLKPWWGYPWRQCHCMTLLQPSPSNACVVMTTTQTEL